MFEMLLGFYIVLVDAPPHKGGKNIQGFYEPKIEFKTEEDCRADRRMIEEWFEIEATRLYPDHKGIDAKAVCVFKTKNGE